MEPMTRRTFFFLGLGIMAGKVLYEMKPTLIYQPTLKQIQFLGGVRGGGKSMYGVDWNTPYLEFYRILARDVIDLNVIWDPKGDDYKELIKMEKRLIKERMK